MNTRFESTFLVLTPLAGALRRVRQGAVADARLAHRPGRSQAHDQRETPGAHPRFRICRTSVRAETPLLLRRGEHLVPQRRCAIDVRADASHPRDSDPRWRPSVDGSSAGDDASTAGPMFDTLLNRIKASYFEMPGLSVTCCQASRLLGIELDICAFLLDLLVASGFLHRSGVGQFHRAQQH